MDEILVKGQDGKWYILKGEELLPFSESGIKNQESGFVDLPKGVTQSRHDALEKSQTSMTNDQKEIATASGLAMTKKVFPALSVVVSHEAHPLRVELEELIDVVMQNVKLKIQNVDWVNDPILQKRFRTIVSARLRDVRDVTETKEMLMRPQKVGGMGLKGELGIMNQESWVEQVMQIIEKAFGEFQAKWKAEEEKKRIAIRQKQEQERASREAQKVKQEQEGLEERYRKMTGAAVPRQQPAQKTQSVRPASEPLLGAQPRSPSAALLPQAAAPKQPFTPSLPSTPFPKEKEKKEEKPKPVAAPTLTSSAIRPPAGKVTDIRPAPKLVGPIEEIGSLRLDDFRRLPGSTASERAQKILEKIELLGKESLARRSQGLEAWRNCPLNQLYGQILGMALQKRSSPQAILSELATSGKNSLTFDEFRAIMELNAKLRF